MNDRSKIQQLFFHPYLIRIIVSDEITKMAEIFSRHTIKSITIVHMEVPCCGGVRYVVDQALEQSGKKIPVTEKTITIQGEIV